MPHVNPIQIQKFLKGVNYPATKSALVENAKNLGADENVCASLEQLPEQDFETPADVSQAFGKMSDDVERRATASGANEFLGQALQDSLAEIELCELALQQTENDEVKVFAQRMIDEHSKLGQEIEKLAGKSKIALPRDLRAEHESMKEELSALSGDDFDRKFVERVVREHEKDVKVFGHYAQEESDPGVKGLADRGMRMLSQHLDMARDISSRLKS